MESGKRQSSGKVKGSGQGNDRGSTPIDVSTDEATIKSHLPSADFDAIENHSNDLHLYTHRFEAFAAMVEQLKGKGCLPVQAAIRKLLASVAQIRSFFLKKHPKSPIFELNQRKILL